MVDLDNYVAQWKAHKYKKPVRGGIILNQDWTKVCCLLRTVKQLPHSIAVMYHVLFVFFFAKFLPSECLPFAVPQSTRDLFNSLVL